MVFRALRVVSETAVELDYLTDNGEVRTFTCAVEDHGGIRTLGSPVVDWPYAYVHSFIDDGGPWKLVGHALTLHRTPLPVDEFLAAVRGGHQSDKESSLIKGDRLSWHFSPYDYSLTMDRGLAEQFRVLLLAHLALGRGFIIEAEGRTLNV